MSRGVFLWASLFVLVHCLVIPFSSAEYNPEYAGCYSENINAETQVPEGKSIFQSFFAQKNASVIRMTHYLSWTVNDIIELSLCEGSDTTTCTNQQFGAARPRTSARPEMTWTEFELGGSIHVIKGRRYFWRWRVVVGQNVRFGLVTMPTDVCDWSISYQQEGKSTAAVFPAPYLRYRLTILEECPPDKSCALVRGRRRHPV